MKDGIIFPIVCGLFLLGCQLVFNHFRKKWVNKKKLKVGNSKLQILDKHFLDTYEPHKYSIEKIVADFGIPIKKYNEAFGEYEVELFQYNFKNAKVLFGKLPDSSDLISVTLFSTIDKKNPVLCRLSFEDEEAEMGKAIINDIIIKESMGFENYSYAYGMNCVIQAKYFYRQIKHLTFSYQVPGNYDTIEDAKGEVITQVCVSQLDKVTPFLSIHDTFYI